MYILSAQYLENSHWSLASTTNHLSTVDSNYQIKLFNKEQDLEKYRWVRNCSWLRQLSHIQEDPKSEPSKSTNMITARYVLSFKLSEKREDEKQDPFSEDIRILLKTTYSTEQKPHNA